MSWSEVEEHTHGGPASHRESARLLGIHHVTAIAGDPQQNVEFYARVLGLRLVKETVNYRSTDNEHLRERVPQALDQTASDQAAEHLYHIDAAWRGYNISFWGGVLRGAGQYGNGQQLGGRRRRP